MNKYKKALEFVISQTPDDVVISDKYQNNAELLEELISKHETLLRDITFMIGNADRNIERIGEKICDHSETAKKSDGSYRLISEWSNDILTCFAKKNAYMFVLGHLDEELYEEYNRKMADNME